MNTSLTINRPEAPVCRPARPNWLEMIEAFFALLFSTADDPAALRYTASKYKGEID
jgi:hypothetical protein